MNTSTAAAVRLANNEPLAAAELALREQLKAIDASPFLGQHDLPPRVENVLRGNLLDDHPVEILEAAFNALPAVTVAYLAGIAQRDTGREGEGEFYPHLERQLDCSLSSKDREALYKAFRRACVRLGLPVLARTEQEDASTWFRVLEYALQAGPPTIALPTLAAACQQTERDLGSPDPFDPDGADQWQQSLVELLQSQARTKLSKVLRADTLAWHARAYGRLSLGAVPVSRFEREFQEAIRATAIGSQNARSRLGPPLVIVFADDEILLVAPQNAPGWIWTVTGSWEGEVVLRPSEELPISTEDQVIVSAIRDPPEDLGEPQGRRLTLWAGAQVLVFETRAGKRCSMQAPAGPLRLLARTPFEVGERRSERLLNGLSSLGLEIADGEALQAVFRDGVACEVVGHTEPRLDWESEPVTELGGKPVFGSKPLRLSVSLSNEARSGWGQELDVVLKSPSLGIARLPVVFTSANEGTVVVDQAQRGSRLDPLIASVVRRGEDRPLIMAPSAWLWPGLRKVEPGLLEGDVPDNFNPAASAGVQVGSAGIVVTNESLRWAEVAFNRTDGGVSRFRLRRPGIFLEVEDGADRRSVEVGAFVIDDGRPRFLRISCDDTNAAVVLPNNTIEQAFRGPGIRHVRLNGLGDTGEAEVLLNVNGDPKRALRLVSVTRPCTPTSADVQRSGGRPRFFFRLADPIELFELSGIDVQSGERLTLRTGGAGVLSEMNGDSWRLWPDETAVDDGVWVFEVRAVLAGREQPRPLRMPRGDRFGLMMAKTHGQLGGHADLLSGLKDVQHRAEVFGRLNDLLTVCWSEICWNAGLSGLAGIWKALGGELARLADQGEVLAVEALTRAAGTAPPPDTNLSWVPLRHPVEVWPPLYSSAPILLATLMRDADDEGARALAYLIEQPLNDSDERRFFHDEACRKFSMRIARCGRDGMNSHRLSQAAWLCHEIDLEMRRADRGRSIPPAPQDESDRTAIVEAAPAFFAEFALANVMEGIVPGAIEGWLEPFEKKHEDPNRKVLELVGLLCRLGPELLAWHLTEARGRSQ